MEWMDNIKTWEGGVEQAHRNARERRPTVHWKYGHWKRRGDSIVLATIEGKTEAKGRRGRRRMEWMDNIKTREGGAEQAHRNARERRSTEGQGKFYITLPPKKVQCEHGFR